MDLSIDHVTIAGDLLEELERRVAAVGLEPDYGGIHSTGVTHMSQLGFPDRSYLEFISTVDPGGESPWWNRHIHSNAGPCAWAVRVEDVIATATEFAERGLPVAGPDRYSRERDDGTVVEFELAFLGGGEPGTELPFFIQDHTPRGRRIEPSASTVDSGLTGIEEVIIGVPSVGSTIDHFRHAFDITQPAEASRPEFGAVFSRLSGLPVSLALPVGDTWLADRVHVFDVCPCGCLLGTDDFDSVLERFPVSEAEPLFGDRLGWFEPTVLPAGRLGVVERGD